jgi:hypothetical protein
MQIWMYYAGEILIYAGLAMSLNLLLGYSGQVSVAHAAFGAVCGYTMGYLVNLHGWSFLPALAVGTVAAFVLGGVMSLPAMKLSVEYLILLTLAVSFVIIGVFETFPSLGGTYGLISIKGLTIFGWHMDKPSDWVIPTLALALLIGGSCWRIGESAFGRVLKGLREDPQATQALGKNVFWYKVRSESPRAWPGCAERCTRLDRPGHPERVRLRLLTHHLRHGDLRRYGQPRRSVLGAIIVGLLEPVLRRVTHGGESRRSRRAHRLRNRLSWCSCGCGRKV